MKDVNLIPEEFFSEDSQYTSKYIGDSLWSVMDNLYPNNLSKQKKLYLKLSTGEKFIWIPKIKRICIPDNVEVPISLGSKINLTFNNWHLDKISEEPNKKYFINTYKKTPDWESWWYGTPTPNSEEEFWMDKDFVGEWKLTENSSGWSQIFSLKQIDDGFRTALSCCFDEKMKNIINYSSIRYKEQLIQNIFYGTRKRAERCDKEG